MSEAHAVDTPNASNAMELTGRDWLVVGILTVLLVILAPAIWRQREQLPLNEDGRMPFAFSNDYWLYRQYAQELCARHNLVVVGDSVMWGRYVGPGATLAHYLNTAPGAEKWGNAALNGAHPAALAGLLEYYGQPITGKKVLLHMNPLWMGSAETDLTDPAKPPQNHPDLLPQFYPGIPSYKEEVSQRLGLVVRRNVSFLAWTGHLQKACFDGMDLGGWTLEHPCDSPLKQLHPREFPPDPAPADAVPWTRRKNVRKQNLPWIPPADSFQWSSFERVLKLLEARPDQVFVLVGPFNDHMLTPESAARYHEVKRAITLRLQQLAVPSIAPDALPSDLYADASHPLAEGYSYLAQILLRDDGFRSFLSH
jgi:hypothetical protein